MELRQLRHFAAVAQYGNFSRAARQSNLTQPALSRQVKNLEEELGLTLLKRTENGVSLTPAGRLFLKDAREILVQTDQAVRRIQRQSREKPLRIGYVPALVMGVMPTVLSRFKSTVVAAPPELLDLTGQEIAARANLGKLDVAILPSEVEVDAPHFQWAPFRQLSPVLVMPRRHPLARFPTVKPDVLEEYPLHGLGYQIFPEYAPRLRALLTPFGIKPVFEEQSADGIATLFQSLEAHTAIAVLCDGVANMLPRSLIVKHFSPCLPALMASVGIYQSVDNGHAEAFVKMLHETVAHLRPRRQNSAS